jgi:ferredoxin
VLTISTTSNNAHADTTVTLGRGQPLGTTGRVVIDADACLALRPASSDCRACVEACPVAALHWTGTTLTLNAACMACGRCASSCPTAALTVSAANLDWPGVTATAIRLECQRVPLARLIGTLRVPCLGGIAPVDILEWLAANPEHTLEWCDRGWCADCPAGGSEFAGASVMARIEPLLSVLEVPIRQWPKTRSVPTDVAAALPLDSTPPSPSIGRRRFFAAFAGDLPDRSPPAAASLRVSRAAHRASPRIAQFRQRWDAAVRRLAARGAEVLPAAIYPEVTVAESCDLAGVCAAVCPSAALTLERDHQASAVALSFNAALCLDCGQCQRACPTQSLQLRPAGAVEQPLPQAPQVLRTLSLQTCQSCGQQFHHPTAAVHCAACRIERSLFDSLFGKKVSASQPCSPVYRTPDSVS